MTKLTDKKFIENAIQKIDPNDEDDFGIIGLMCDHDFLIEDILEGALNLNRSDVVTDILDAGFDEKKFSNLENTVYNVLVWAVKNNKKDAVEFVMKQPTRFFKPKYKIYMRKIISDILENNNTLTNKIINMAKKDKEILDAL